jgi:hypothetical protein
MATRFLCSPAVGAGDDGVHHITKLSAVPVPCGAARESISLCGVVWCPCCAGSPVWCGAVWCGVVRCGVVWCGVVWCGVVWCGVVWCGVVWCGVVWCGAVWCGVVWCGVVWCMVRCGVGFSKSAYDRHTNTHTHTHTHTLSLSLPLSLSHFGAALGVCARVWATVCPHVCECWCRAFLAPPFH